MFPEKNLYVKTGRRNETLTLLFVRSSRKSGGHFARFAEHEWDEIKWQGTCTKYGQYLKVLSDIRIRFYIKYQHGMLNKSWRTRGCGDGGSNDLKVLVRSQTSHRGKYRSLYSGSDITRADCYLSGTSPWLGVDKVCLYKSPECRKRYM